MKNLYFLILALLISTNASSTNREELFQTKIIYKLTYIPDSREQDKKSEEYFELLINNEYTLFRSINKGKNDSTDHAEKERINSVNSQGGEYQYPRLYPTSFAFNILFNKEQIFFYESLRDMKQYSYTENINDISDKWILRDDTNTIDNYKCQLAELNYGKRDWKAWFTAAIPLNEGPYKFKNLPGLIVKVEDEGKNWVFELVSIHNNQSKDVEISSFEKATELPKKEFYKTKRYLLDNWFDLANASGNIKYSSKDIENRVRKESMEKAAADNNWIELYP
ncbi:GLPGLI family protein [Sphingobacterium sp. MYb382]|uniref:GLPGLI family protein n=1 Tax=Sphingobacterium sp. MYb382 TaxID=2745278 RepID=UPI0030AF3324